MPMASALGVLTNPHSPSHDIAGLFGHLTKIPSITNYYDQINVSDSPFLLFFSPPSPTHA